MTLSSSNYIPFTDLIRTFSLANGRPTFPHHNIIKSDNKYIIEMAVAGFTQNDIDLEVVEDVLHVKGKIETKPDEGVEFLHHGIATRSFHKTIELNNAVEVVGADLQYGILSIELERIVPEEKKAKKIPIGIVNNKKQLLVD
jgi:molecular chaperone IbpA